MSGEIKGDGYFPSDAADDDEKKVHSFVTGGRC